MSEATATEPMLFLLSFRQRDELAGQIAAAGWRVVAARRADGAAGRLRASGAAVAVVDARGAIDDGHAAVRALAPVAEADGAALLVLVSRNDADRLGALLDAGATHFLVSPVRDLLPALRFAQRHAERIGGWRPRTATRVEPLGWRYDPARRSLQLTPGLAAMLELADGPRPRALLARLDPTERGFLRTALARLSPARTTTAFAHDLPGVGRVVEHLQFDPKTGRLHALVETLGAAPDASAAVRDALTGAQDASSARRWLDRRLGEGTGVSALLVGFTRFETVNTAYGRAAGDALLRAVSRRIEDAVRETLGRAALVARIGGSEFLVAVEGRADRLAAAAQRIDEALMRPFPVGDTVAALGARVALAESIAGDDAATLLARAGEILRAAGRPGLDAPLDALAAELAQAMEAGEIEIRFQPQVAVATGAITGVEALARWRHGTRGEIGAETLFAAAERAGLERALSDHVQALALGDAARWPAALSALRLAINVTAGDVGRAGFADMLLDRIDASGFPRQRLTVEITETELIEELGEAARLLAELRTAGCRVAIDDFGTGYSSLAYLKALPLDYLKIDKKLSQDITGSARDRVVVRGVIDMARSLGLAVIAEGVETEAQLALLAKEGCQYYQGFLCSEAVETATLERLVAGERIRASGA